MTTEELRALLQTEVLDIVRAAHFLGIRSDSLETAAARGRIPFIHIGRKKLFLKADLEDYKASRSKTSRPAVRPARR